MHDAQGDYVVAVLAQNLFTVKKKEPTVLQSSSKLCLFQERRKCCRSQNRVSWSHFALDQKFTFSNQLPNVLSDKKGYWQDCLDVRPAVSLTTTIQSHRWTKVERVLHALLNVEFS